MDEQSDKSIKNNDDIFDISKIDFLLNKRIPDLIEITNDFNQYVYELGIDMDELLECNFEQEIGLNESNKYLLTYYMILRFCIIMRYYISKSNNKELFYELNEKLNDLVLFKNWDYIKYNNNKLNEINLDINHPLIYASIIKFKKVLEFYNTNFKGVDLSKIISIQALSELNFNVSTNNCIFYKSKYVNKKLYFNDLQSLGKLYDISAFRFIEKIEKVINYADNLKEIRVAIFGETNIDYLKEKYQCKTDYNKKVIFDEYKFVEKKGSLPFRCREEIINLYSYDDLKRLFANHQLVLFLDNSYFYDIKRVNVNDNIYNYYSLVKNTKVKIDDFYNSKSPISFKNLFNYLSTSYYSFLTGESCRLEYDHILFNLLLSIVGSMNRGSKDTEPLDVYAFISQENDIIGSRNLSEYCYCKDEYYEGKKVTVVKFPNSSEIKSKLNNGLDKSHNIVQMSEDKSITYEFSAWKLYKSLDIKYAEDYVHCLRNISIVCQFVYEEYITIKYYIKLDDSKNNTKKECINQVETFFDFLLKAVFKNTNTIVSEYLEDILLSILLSTSKSIDEIFFVYLLKDKQNKLPKFYIVKDQNDEGYLEESLKDNYTYKQKKLLLMIMEELGSLVLHQEVDVQKYIMNDMYNGYTSYISIDTMKEIILVIKKLCEKFNFIEDNIYNNVSVFKDEKFT